MSFTVFRLLGDWLHTVAILMILHRLFVGKNAQGVSRKTQELCLLTSVFRYLDLFTLFYSPYNTLMKLYYVLTTAAFVYIMTDFSRHAIAITYRPDQDFVNHWKLIFLPCLILGALTHGFEAGWGSFDWMEWLFAVSLFLEACACIPQIFMFRQYRQVESLTGGSFILLMGLYRGCYVLNYIYRYQTQKGYSIHWALGMTSVLQCLICLLGVFWPVRKGESEAAALLPQLIQFYTEIRSAKTGAVLSGTICLMLGGIFQGTEGIHCTVCSSLLLVMTILFTAFVVNMWRAGDIKKRRGQICAILSCLILWGVLLGAPFIIIILLVVTDCLVLSCYRTDDELDVPYSTKTLDPILVGSDPNNEGEGILLV